MADIPKPKSNFDAVGEIGIRRTGNIYSIASSEFEVTYPDGSRGTVWSPPWHEMSPKEEEDAARQYASDLYSAGKHLSSQIDKEKT